MYRPHVRAWALVCSVVILGSSVVGSGVTQSGIAQSSGDYRIERGENLLPHLGNDLAEIQAGDVIVAADQPVSLQTANGDALLVGENSRVEVASADAMNVGAGKIAVNFAANSALRPNLGGLEIVPLANTGSVQSVVFAAVLESGEVVVKSVSNAFAVRPVGAASSASIATIGSGDTMSFAASSVGTWLPVSSPLIGDEVVQAGALSEHKDRQGLFWWFSGSDAAKIGITAGLIGGAIVLIDEGTDDDGSGGGSGDNNEEFFPPPPPPPFSPVGP